MKRLPINKSDFKKEIGAFTKGGGKIKKLPAEIEWDMFPYWDDCAIERNKNEAKRKRNRRNKPLCRKIL